MNKGWRFLKWTAVCTAFVLLFGLITMTLWNWLVPVLFNGPTINFIQGLGLLLLSKILFGGFGGGRCSGGHRGMYWKHRYADKLAAMSPEEREQFKTKMREKWCYRDQSSAPSKTDTSNV
jgi:hypothetical protein